MRNKAITLIKQQHLKIYSIPPSTETPCFQVYTKNNKFNSPNKQEISKRINIINRCGRKKKML